jgi:hypothetical protein
MVSSILSVVILSSLAGTSTGLNLFSVQNQGTSSSSVDVFRRNTHKVCSKIISRRYRRSNLEASVSSTSATLQAPGCLPPTQPRILPVTTTSGRTAPVVICGELSSGMVGVVFEGLLPSDTGIPLDPQLRASLAADAAVAAVLSEAGAQTWRRVAVKFATKQALSEEGAVSAEDGEKIHADMEEEIENLVKMASPFVVEYLGRIDVEPEMSGNVLVKYDRSNANIKPRRITRVEPLGAPGIVMEFLQGVTVASAINPRLDMSQDEKNEMACYAGQLALAFGAEMKNGYYNDDLHLGNAMILENSSDKYFLSDTISCNRIKTIDLGIVKAVQTDIEGSLSSLISS